MKLFSVIFEVELLEGEEVEVTSHGNMCSDPQWPMDDEVTEYMPLWEMAKEYALDSGKPHCLVFITGKFIPYVSDTPAGYEHDVEYFILDISTTEMTDEIKRYIE